MYDLTEWINNRSLVGRRSRVRLPFRGSFDSHSFHGRFVLPRLTNPSVPAKTGRSSSARKGRRFAPRKNLLDKWPEDGPLVVWKKKNRHERYSAPSVMGNRLVVIHRPKDEDIVDCVHAVTGKPIWNYKYDTDYADPYGLQQWPRCTPLLTKNRCLHVRRAGKLLCLDLESGKKVWERDTGTDWKVPGPFLRFRLYADSRRRTLDRSRRGATEFRIVAFDPETAKPSGKPSAKRPGMACRRTRTTNSLQMDRLRNDRQLLVADRRHHSRPANLFCLMRQGLVSLDPKTGKLNFKYWFRAKVHESVNAAGRFVIGDEIFLSAAYETGYRAVESETRRQGV